MVEEAQGSEALVPSRRVIIFRVDGQCHTAHGFRNGQRSLARRHEEFSTQLLYDSLLEPDAQKLAVTRSAARACSVFRGIPVPVPSGIVSV
jgi:hypothetical protein